MEEALQSAMSQNHSRHMSSWCFPLALLVVVYQNQAMTLAQMMMNAFRGMWPMNKLEAVVLRTKVITKLALQQSNII